MGGKWKHGPDELTIGEAAEVVGVHRATLERAIKSGELRREGTFLRRADVADWQARRAAKRDAAWVEFTCDGCGEPVRRERSRYRRSASGFHFCGECAHDGTVRKVRAQARIAARHERVRELHAAGHHISAMADDLGVSRGTVRNDLAALGLTPNPPSSPRRHPVPEPRVCANPDCPRGGEPFTPPDAYQVTQGNGRYCTRECARDASRRHPAPGERACEWCGGTFRISPADAAPPGHGRFCTPHHRQLYYFWYEPEKVEGLVESLRRDGAWTGSTDRRWNGKRKLRQVRNPSKKGEANALETGKRAVEHVRAIREKKGDVADMRTAIIEALMRELVGPATTHVDGKRRNRKDDKVYKAAREKIRRRLVRARELLNAPEDAAALADLLEATSVDQRTDVASVGPRM